jgi:hypothetical protein
LGKRKNHLIDLWERGNGGEENSKLAPSTRPIDATTGESETDGTTAIKESSLRVFGRESALLVSNGEEEGLRLIEETTEVEDDNRRGGLAVWANNAAECRGHVRDARACVR